MVRFAYPAFKGIEIRYMLKDPFPDIDTLRISPGEYCSVPSGGIISTLLGSCVAACIYDPIAELAGMNHFLLSNRRYARDLSYIETEAGRYGVHAMELLINKIIRAGARRERLQAKAFGGAAILSNSQSGDNFHCVGFVNCRFIKEFLATERIPLMSADLGGEHGRVIYFDTRDFSVYVRKIRKTQSIKLAQRDHTIWQREIREHELAIRPDVTTETNVDLWL